MKKSALSIIVSGACCLFSLTIQASNTIRYSQGDVLPTLVAGSTHLHEKPAVITEILVLAPSSYASTATHAYVLMRGDEAVSLSSCKDYIEQSDAASKDGVYMLTNAGQTYPAYCNQTSFGGGWTMVAAQYKQSPVTWNGAVNGLYDVALTDKRGWSLSTGQLPAHNNIGFSQGNSDGFSIPRYLVNITYSTSNIAKTLAYDNSGVGYHIHRSTVGHYSNHDPEYIYYSASTQWDNTLTIDQVGGIRSSYAFSPLHPSENSRGYAYNGVYLGTTAMTGAWFLWVK